MQKLIKNTWETMIKKKKNCHIFNIGMQKPPVNNFEWIKDTSQFNEDFIKNYKEGGDERYFLEVDVQYLEYLYNLHNDLPFAPARMKIETVEKLVVNLHDKTEHVIHIRNLKTGITSWIRF